MASIFLKSTIQVAFPPTNLEIIHYPHKKGQLQGFETRPCQTGVRLFLDDRKCIELFSIFQKISTCLGHWYFRKHVMHHTPKSVTKSTCVVLFGIHIQSSLLVQKAYICRMKWVLQYTLIVLRNVCATSQQRKISFVACQQVMASV